MVQTPAGVAGPAGNQVTQVAEGSGKAEVWSKLKNQERDLHFPREGWARARGSDEPVFCRGEEALGLGTVRGTGGARRK